MAETLPQIKISSASSKPTSPIKSQTLNMGDPTSNHPAQGRVGSNEPTQNLRGSQGSINNGLVATPDESNSQQNAIDPLSQHILKRTNTCTNTQNMASQRGRNSGASDGESGTPDASLPSGRTSSEPAVARADGLAPPTTKDRKKRVSFLSRFIGAKKKDILNETNDDEAETGDRRTEGMDAVVFSQPIEFIPRFPAPPKYIKVRAHNKKEKDFNRVFLAQELRGRTGVEIAQAGGRLVTNGISPMEAKKDGGAVWAMEFSKDGKYLAASGQDFSVRVWAVISTAEERRVHETEEDVAGKDGESVRLNAPVFKTKTVQEYEGHTASILDLSWSKNNFLLSSSMDKTVRLWHVRRAECLCCFKHSDFVTSIQFHPRDDRFFLAGSLDSKLRLWSIPDKSVAFWKQLPDLITAVAFSPDGKTAIAGCHTGLCQFFETEGLKLNQRELYAKSSHGKNAKGSKITGIKTMNYPPDDPAGEVKVLITSNDSRVRIYNLRDKTLAMKLRGNENSCSQIHANFSDDGKYVICGSEDRKAYIWSLGPTEGEKDKRPVEMFEAHTAIVTTAVIAPIKTRQLLGKSGDPLYDLCNPPPVTLVSRDDSRPSSKPVTEDDSIFNASVTSTPAALEFSNTTKPEGSPAYIARSAHPDGNIIVTADYLGRIKVFRQDCAYQKRLRNNDANFSKRMMGRSTSVATRNSKGSRRDSLSNSNNHPSSDRILSWRQSISSTNGSVDNVHPSHRSNSPRKSLGQALNSPRPPTSATPPSIATNSPPRSSHGSQDSKSRIPYLSPTITSNNINSKNSEVRKQSSTILTPNPDIDPLMLQGDHSYMFWNKSQYRPADNAPSSPEKSPKPETNGLHPERQGQPGPTRSRTTSASTSTSADRMGIPAAREMSVVSTLSSEEEDGEGADLRCERCGGATFRARGKGTRRKLECGACGEVA